MSFPQSSHAIADIDKPLPWAVCDRCGFRRMRSDLVWQFDYRGLALANLRILVCIQTCNDMPQPQLKPILVGPDPIPVKDPRPGFLATQQGFTPSFSVLEIVDGDILPGPPPPDLINDGGIVVLPPGNTWPTSSAPGDLYNNGGAACVTLPVTPNPLAPLLFIWEIGATAANVLTLGGEFFPEEDPGQKGAMWNNNGQLCFSLG